MGCAYPRNNFVLFSRFGVRLGSRLSHGEEIETSVGEVELNGCINCFHPGSD